MAISETLPPTTERVRLHSSPEANEAIRRRSDASVARYETASDDELAGRLTQLSSEWDVERTLQVNAGTLALTGTLLGWRVNPWFFLLPAAVFSFFLQHALQGWCPPIPVFRRMGVRTVDEIERERYALKALRGDFDLLAVQRETGPVPHVRAVLEAVDR